jgi:integrase
MRFTMASVAALKRLADKADHVEWDDDLPGFGVRLRGNSKTYLVQFRVGLQQRRESVGDVRKMKLDDARKVAQQRFAQAKLGIDPAAERAKARAAAAAATLTLGAVVERYLATKETAHRPRTHAAARRYLTKHWGSLRDRPLDDIKRADLAARLHDLTKAHGRIAAARARSTLSALYTWAMKEGMCEANPVASTNAPDAGVKPRERVLSDAEIKTLWAACREDSFGKIVKLLVFTGARRDEIGGLRWDEVDLDAGTATILGTRTKSHRTLALPLSGPVVGILRSVPRIDGRIHVFGRHGGNGFGGWSGSMTDLRLRIATIVGKTPDWTLHDLRRTMRSGLGRLGVPPHVAELAIGHSRKGIEATYDKYHYGGEIAAALDKWAAHVMAVVEGRAAKVVPLRA